MVVLRRSRAQFLLLKPLDTRYPVKHHKLLLIRFQVKVGDWSLVQIRRRVRRKDEHAWTTTPPKILENRGGFNVEKGAEG